MKKYLNWDFTWSWQWLLTLQFLLPAAYFLLALFFGANTMGRIFSGLYRIYTLYIVSPFPNFSRMQGLIGIVLPLFFLYRCLRRKNLRDFFVCLIILATTISCYALSFHTYLLRFLHFDW